MNHCYKCHSQKVVQGKLTIDSWRLRGPIIFRPHSLRPFAFAILGGTPIDPQSFACLDCGLVWTLTSTEELCEFVRKHCSEESNRPVHELMQQENERILADAQWQGLRCVSCRAPIQQGIALCPKCGWTQPKYKPSENPG